MVMLYEVLLILEVVQEYWLVGTPLRVMLMIYLILEVSMYTSLLNVSTP